MFLFCYNYVKKINLVEIYEKYLFFNLLYFYVVAFIQGQRLSDSDDIDNTLQKVIIIESLI